MPLINWKTEIKHKWNNFALFAAGVDNINNRDPANIIFTIKDTKLYVLVVTLSARDNQKLSKLLIKGFERSVYWNEYNQVIIKIRQINLDIFSNQILLELTD